MEKIRVAIAGVGNCASSLIQGVTYYKDAKPGDDVPGLMHVVLGGYHVSDLEFVAAFDVDASKVGNDLGKAIDGGQNNTIKFADVPSLGVTVQRGPTMDGLNKYYRAVIEESPGRGGRRRPGAARRARRGPRLVPARGLRGRPALLRPGRPRRRRRLRQRHSGLHRLGPGLGEEVRRRRRADHRRRHQEPGRRHHRAPRARATLRGPRPHPRPHLPAQRRRQHGLQEHARPRAPRVEEGLQDPGRDVAARDLRTWTPTTCTSDRATTCRGCTDRKWAYIRMEGRNFGDVPLNVELKLEVWDSPNSAGRHHRRGALREGRPGPRHRWSHHRAVAPTS